MDNIRHRRLTLHHGTKSRKIRAFVAEWGLTEDPVGLRANWRVFPLPRCVFAKRRQRQGRTE